MMSVKVKSYRFLLINLISFIFISGFYLDINAQSVVINEVMFENHSSFTDMDGDTPDWIELYNRDTVSVQLSGFGLTDDKSLDDIWLLPEYELAPGEFLVVFASGKNRRTGLDLHTDFKLGLMEEQLFLVNSNGVVVDSTTIRCVPTDKSLVCMPDGEISGRCIAFPTPGYSNINAQVIDVDYRPDSLWFDVQGGFYASAVQLNLYNKFPQNVIHYTLDADDPNERDSVFHDVLSLHDLTSEKIRFADEIDNGFELGEDILKAPVVRAQVYSSGCPASEIVSQTYFIGNKYGSRYHVPVISIITDEDNLFDDDEGIYVLGNNNNFLQSGKSWERPIQLEIFNEEGLKVIDQQAGMRIHGAGSRSRPQKSLRLYARQSYGDSLFEYPFFTQKPYLHKFNRLLLRAVKDWGETLLKDDLAQQLVSTMNMDYTASQPSVVFINGEYWGIYSLRERQDEFYVADNYNVPVPHLNVVAYTRDGLSADEGDLQSYTDLVQWLHTADPSDVEFYDEANALIDLDAMTDYYIAQLYFANTDWPENNFRMWRMVNDTARWRYLFYDCDACMIRFDLNNLAEYTSDNEDVFQYQEHATYVFRRMMQNSTFSSMFRSQLAFHLTHTFGTQRVVSELETLKDVYAPLVSEHTYRWNTPTDLVMWLNNVERLESFAVQRPMAMREHLINQLGNALVVYPNPSQGQFNIEPHWGNGQMQVCIVDVTGKLVYENVVATNADGLYTLDVQLEPGVYVVSAISDGMRFTQKVMVL